MADLRETDPILWRSLHQYDRATHDARHYAGTILLDDKEVAQTLQCCHCNAHFLNVKIPGKERGWCMRCNAPVCPNKQCDECIPFLELLECMEKNIHPSQRPIKVAVRACLPGHEEKAPQKVLLVGE